MKCGYSQELGHDNEENPTMHYQYQFLGRINPTEKVIHHRMSSEFNQGYVPESLNISIITEQAIIYEIRGYDKVFLNYHSRRRGQKVYNRISMQGIENLVCINKPYMIDWHQATFPVERWRKLNEAEHIFQINFVFDCLFAAVYPSGKYSYWILYALVGLADNLVFCNFFNRYFWGDGRHRRRSIVRSISH